MGKLISSPTESPPVYICDECVTVCNSILEDDREYEPKFKQPEDHRWLNHPMTSHLLVAVENWTQQELAGRDASEELAKMRMIVLLMTAEEQ